MKKQFTYEIEINSEKKTTEILEFTFLCNIGNNSPKQYIFFIGRQYAKIQYLMSDKQSIEDIVKKSSAFKEAIRKSLLLHVVNENEGALSNRNNAFVTRMKTMDKDADIIAIALI